VLASNDKLKVNEDSENARAKYRDQYFWLSIRGAPAPRLFGQSIVSIGSPNTQRSGSYGAADFFDETGNANDEHHSRILSFKNDASFDLSPRNVIKGGLTLRKVSGQ